MKKILFSILFLTGMYFTSFAQQGMWALGVYSTIDNVEWQDYSLAPTVGYFISDNMVVGMGFNMGNSTQTTPEVQFDPWGVNSVTLEDETKTSSTNIMPYLRYYISEGFFGQLGVDLGSTKSNTIGNTAVWLTNTNGDYYNAGTDISTTEVKNNTFGWNLMMGYSLGWNDKVFIEPALTISGGSGSGSTTTTQSIYGFGSVTSTSDSNAPNTFDVGLGLGINIRLGE